MAKLHISEFGQQGKTIYGPLLAVASVPPVAEQVVTFSSSTQSAALNAETTFVRVIADADCHIAAGANPTATTSTMKLISGQAEYFGVTPGQKIAVIAA